MSESRSRGPETRDSALDLLRDVDESAPLTDTTKRRIWDRVDRATKKRSRTSPAWALAMVGGLAVVLAALFMRQPIVSQRAASRHQDFVVPACNITRATDDVRHYRASFVGPTEVEIDDGGLVLLKSGRILLTSSDHPVDVSVRGASVMVLPSSFVEVVVRDFKSVQVAAYSGTALLQSAGQSVTIDAGKTWTDGLIGSTTESGAATAKRLAEDNDAALDLCTERPHHVEPRPATAEPLPTPRRRASAARAAAPHVADAVPAPLQPESPNDDEPVKATVPAEPQLPREAAQLAEAIQKLRQDHDPGAAIKLLDDIEHTTTGREFAQEAELVRLEALQALGDMRGVLRILDALPLPHVPRGNELLLVRADLRAKAQRCREAITDYTALIALGRSAEPSLYRRAACSFQLGDTSAARSDLESYLQQFPDGTLATEARRALGRQP